MASYTDLYNLHNNSDLFNKVRVACYIAAKGILDELDTVENHVNRLTWATNVFTTGGEQEADEMYRILVADNESETIATIEGAADAVVLANVNDNINFFATG